MGNVEVKTHPTEIQLIDRFPMAQGIQHYWQKFEAIQERLFGDPENRATQEEVSTELNRLTEVLSSDIAQRRDNLTQLSYWAATFHRLIAELALDLDNMPAAIAAYEQSLDFSFDLETWVRLLDTLCGQGMVAEACSRLTELDNHQLSFFGSKDAESAARFLKIVGSHPEIASSVDPRVLVDALQAVAIRGVADLTLKALR